MRYKQVIISIVCVLGLSVGVTQYDKLMNKKDENSSSDDSEFEVPPEDRPGNRGDGGGRDPNNSPELCPQMDKPLLALVPQKNFGYTLASHPTFWLYIPGYSKSIDFTLIDDKTEDKIYQTNFNVESERGIISLKLPPAAPPLMVGKEYRWLFVFNCGDGTKDLLADGVVARNKANDSLSSRLNSATTVMEKIDIYAENGLWHETITELGNLRRSNPDDVAIKTKWNSLLQQKYIRFENYDLTSEPIQDCCDVGGQ
ncbi:MAG: DUF928 domain-containing protein [Okeania sp. SIO3B5]|uniref:DUF928 domain-containing protein n=1 Tax=Okeania sp. SIO3B5 TaxID=2607811 RepID=UPI001400EC6D|nr:DUF928 domain-containing protein [Okeania sp. SIO3B5]NEO55944.1 DUF928 domain-containing protein [Okeania sp. SIO3B5]